jgi:dynein light chain roadblock-type
LCFSASSDLISDPLLSLSLLL